jgi:hypothetical protein
VPYFRRSGPDGPNHHNLAAVNGRRGDPRSLKPRNHRYSLEFPGYAALVREPRLSKQCLLKFNLGADFFELRLDLGGVFLVGAVLNSLRRAFD